jgi:hypothetical protein
MVHASCLRPLLASLASDGGGSGGPPLTVERTLEGLEPDELTDKELLQQLYS